MYSAIFVRLMQSISMVFRKLTDCNTHPVLIIKYSTYYIFYVGLKSTPTKFQFEMC